MFDALFQGLTWLIAQFYALVPSYAAAISLLTVAVMLLLAPLTLKSTRSMLALQKLQPEMKRLQQEHKNDRVALNEAMMAFYKEHKINPLGGCVPVLLQMPVFLVMYNVISGLRHVPKPKYLDQFPDTRLYQDLVADQVERGGELVSRMPSLGIDLAKSASTALDGSLASALPYCILVALVVVTGYVQAKQSMSRNPAAAQANPQAMMIQKVFPVLFGFISFSIPAGVVVYFLVSNLFRIAQQELMYRFDPVIKTTVGSEVREVEAKASEITRRERSAGGKEGRDRGTKPSSAEPKQSGRVTPKAGGSSGNGGRNRSTKKSKRGR